MSDRPTDHGHRPDFDATKQVDGLQARWVDAQPAQDQVKVLRLPDLRWAVKPITALWETASDVSRIVISATAVIAIVTACKPEWEFAVAAISGTTLLGLGGLVASVFIQRGTRDATTQVGEDSPGG